MSDSPASPLPWRVEGEQIVDANGKPIAVVYKQRSYHTRVAAEARLRAEANAQLIVDAVNSNEMLIDALTWADAELWPLISMPEKRNG